MSVINRIKESKSVKTIGIIGGGQLGLMLAEQARELGVQTVCLDPATDAPAFAVCDKALVGRFDDLSALEQLAQQCDVLTYEFENVPGEILTVLEQNYNIKQGVKPLFDSQDRLREKTNARECGLQTPDFMAVDGLDSLREAVAKIGLPAVLKTRTLGYDGHGQRMLRSEDDIATAESMLVVPCILEQFISFDYEVSIIMVSDGEQIISFPVGRNIHRDGILDLCVVPSLADDELLDQMKSRSEKFMRKCGYRGILAIEYFVKHGEIWFNEMAPRPHNSGHYTIEGASTNQFRELVRYLICEPLQEPILVAPVVMKNILGQDLEVAQELYKEQCKGVYVHLYGKSESRLKRKMGHITFVGCTHEQYEQRWADRFKK